MSGRSCNRKMITDEQIETAIANIRIMLKNRLDEKGKGSFASRHELNGILAEEFYELQKASHEAKNGFGIYELELMDIAVGCIFGTACVIAGSLEW